MADKSYFSEAKKNTFSAINGFGDSIISKDQEALKEYVKGRGGWSGIFWIFSAIGAVMLVGLGFMVHRNVTRPVKKIVHMMLEIEKGHLS